MFLCEQFEMQIFLISQKESRQMTDQRANKNVSGIFSHCICWIFNIVNRADMCICTQIEYQWIIWFCECVQMIHKWNKEEHFDWLAKIIIYCSDSLAIPFLLSFLRIFIHRILIRCQYSWIKRAQKRQKFHSIHHI